MGDAERTTMEARLAGMTEEQKNHLLLELAEGMRPGDDDQGKGRVQSAEAILALRPKVEVWTLLPRTGRIDKRRQDRKVWDTPGVLDPMASEDMPDRPQIIKVIDLQDGSVLFERDTVMGQPTPGQPVPIYAGGRSLPPPGVQAHAMGPVTDTDLAARMVALLKGNPELRQAVVEMADETDGPPAAEPTVLPPLAEGDAKAEGPTGPTKRQRRQQAMDAAGASKG
jgi:hypothetical protein